MLTKELLEAEGWKHTWTYDRQDTYGGQHPTKMEFRKNDVWQMGGAFLTFLPETNAIRISSVDEGFTMDGPKNSVKFQGACPTLDDFRYILKLVNIN
jgi:hypothetical protein